MIDLSDITLDVVENDGKKGVFKIGPLTKGYGHTLANSLRRVLLSSISGGGVTSMTIAGVDHEYSTIKGIKENVVEIMMNVKGCRFGCESDEPQVIRLSKKGAGDVTAGDFELTESVTVLDPKKKIATMTDKNASIDMEVVVERGIGYRVADEELRSEVGRLPMDADFSPIERVTFSIDTTRKGEMMDLDLITLTIFTDGSIDPKDALGRASNVLKGTYERMMVITGVEAPPIAGAVEEPKVSEEIGDEAKDWLVEDLPISKRAKSSLIEAGFTTLADVVGKSPKELLEVPGFGEAALNELRDVAKEYGLTIE